MILRGNPNNPTLDQLIAMLEGERQKHGGDVLVGIVGGELLLYRNTDELIDTSATPLVEIKPEADE